MSVCNGHRWLPEAGGIQWSNTNACQGTVLCGCVWSSVSIGHLLRCQHSLGPGQYSHLTTAATSSGSKMEAVDKIPKNHRA